MANMLYYGDNLEVLRRHVDDESVDLVYLDPPFKSNADYNVLFREHDGTRSAAQIKAFDDTWKWDTEAAAAFDDALHSGHKKLPETMIGLRSVVGESDMLAYLSMMAPRLVELWRVLKPTGSLYLHCDPTASHYLKVILDAVLEPQNFRSEIIWRRTMSKGLAFTGYPKNHDTLLYYSRGAKFTFNRPYDAYDPDNLDEKTGGKYRHRDKEGRLYRLSDLTNPNHNRPNLTYEFLGVTKVWRWTKERMQKAYEDGLVIQTKPGAVPQFKRYLDEQEGRPIDTVWNDIPPINSQAQERLGYPTQKPESLLQRIIAASSNPGDVVLDPFCGCGTAIAAAQSLGRHWIGIDITHVAVGLIKHRLLKAHKLREKLDYSVTGEPESLQDARALAEEDRHQFQAWALGLVGARTDTSAKKGADRGIDGKLYFYDTQNEPRTMILSVKSGKIDVKHVRELIGVLERENAALGVIITLEKPTAPMRRDAASAGFFEYRWGLGVEEHQRIPRIQIATIEELLGGKRIEMPHLQQNVTFKTAPKAKPRKTDKQTTMDWEP